MKITKKVIAIIMILVMTMSGCSSLITGAHYAGDVLKMKEDSSVMEAQYLSIYDLLVSKKDSFTDEEWLEFEDINFAFTTTATRIKDMMKHPEKIVTPEQLRQMYELAYIGYTNARVIILRHKADFTSFQWERMEQFDKRAHQYDIDVRKVLDNPDTDDINMTLGVIITLSGAAYKYLLPVAISMMK